MVSGLRFRYDKADDCLRSVGDQPNGVVGAMLFQGTPSVVVSPTIDPTKREPIVEGPGENRTQAETIEVEAAAGAVADEYSAGYLRALAAGLVHMAVDVGYQTGSWDEARDAVGFAQELDRAIGARFS